MKKRLLYLVRFYLLTVLLFIAAKVVFMFCNRQGHSFALGDVCDVIRHGLSLDLSTALYFLIVPFLLTVVGLWWRVPRWVFRIYYAVIAVAFALAFVADTSLYAFWQFKLDASCIGYLESPPEVTASVSTGYLLLRLIALVVVAAGIYGGYEANGANGTHGANGIYGAHYRFLEPLLYLLLIPLMVIGIRGGLDESTTNIGQVYYSQNQFLNHSAVNPVFSFLYSLSHQVDNADDYRFMEDAACEALVKDVFTTESLLGDTLLNTTRPDILIILLESCGEEFSQFMPRLQQLKREGVNFSRCYGNSWRTDRGTLCTLSGYPSFPTLSVMKMPEKSRMLPSIARTLQKEGYETGFLYGGDINFTNMRSYLISTGWEKLRWKADYPSEIQKTAKWGVRDDITFGTLYELMTLGDTTKQQPQLTGYSTLSSHEPWDVPTKRLADEVANAFDYLDNCLGDFVDRMKKTDRWQRLLIVLTADHGINYNDIDEQRPLERNHIPMLWIGGAVKGPRTIDILCNQTDLAATLLGQLQLPHDDFRFSRDVLSKSYTSPTAVHNYNNAQLLIDSTGYVLYDFDGQRLTVSQGSDTTRLLRLNKAILQKTMNDLNNL